MSVAHHGDDKKRLDEFMKRFVQQGEGNASRAYPEGRMGAADEGELVFTVSTDEKHGTVVLNFNKPVSWMGMGPADAVRLAELLIEHAKRISKEPLAITLT